MPQRNMPRSAAVYGIAIGKNIFQVVGLGSDGVPIQKVRFRRDTLLQFFDRAAPAIVGMESCAGSQWIARKIHALGHKVRLIPAQFVKPYVKSNKNRHHRCGGDRRSSYATNNAVCCTQERRTSRSSGFAQGARPDDRNANAPNKSDASLLPGIRNCPAPGRGSVQARPATSSRRPIQTTLRQR